ncbi:hypothetical protein F8M41_007621 [Gigaspora margarita]|uniref:Uncharacterized protein n=1 Tax=Gigaspora margarita TaxID=4874 RepID=A0A8H3X7A4_GIGMA|nr:hypothetical protein F8M41_007620 [Gigaspora margarita]KAF0415574.1 hypothetical protein F8M41_007621 [Gigaspora margarita]
MWSMPQKKISFSNTKSSKKHKSAKPGSERSLLHNKTSSKKSSASSDKKSSKDTRLLKIPANNITLNAFFAILRSMVDSFTQINFIRKIIPNDVATITCRITSPSGKNIQVPGALIDSGANCSLKSKGLAKLLGMNIDKNKKPSVKWLHKSQREIFKPEINLTFHKQDETKTRRYASSVQVSTDSSRPEGESEIQHFVPSLIRTPEGATLKGHSSSSKDNNVLLEEWHAPAGFCPDFSLSSENDFLQSKSLDDESEMSQRFEAQLPQDFTSSPNYCEAGHFVSDMRLDLKSQCSAIKKK